MIKVNNKKISDITEIGYGYSGDRNILLQFEKPSVNDGVSIKSNINDVDFESGHYISFNIWNVLETINKMNFINKMKSFVSQETWLISS